jgi:hypothetical protein
VCRKLGRTILCSLLGLTQLVSAAVRIRLSRTKTEVTSARPHSCVASSSGGPHLPLPRTSDPLILLEFLII